MIATHQILNYRRRWTIFLFSFYCLIPSLNEKLVSVHTLFTRELSFICNCTALVLSARQVDRYERCDEFGVRLSLNENDTNMHVFKQMRRSQFPVGGRLTRRGHDRFLKNRLA